ncbi:unnamed protein product [Chrysodeixis includens]|uniref:Uncharacterized protein n=1 Tax=Chrysodeixis includens TaxID=689277 RepID=A0A9N8KYZ1_CHRIL|nr:unnamed protein product [Chrysodeixis includens]
MMYSIWELLGFKAEGAVATVADPELADNGLVFGTWERVPGVELDSWLVAVDLQVAPRVWVGCPGYETQDLSSTGVDTEVVIEEVLPADDSLTDLLLQSEVEGCAFHIGKGPRRDRIRVCFGDTIRINNHTMFEHRFGASVVTSQVEVRVVR